MPEDREPSGEELERRVRHLLGDDSAGPPAPSQEVDPVEAQLAEIEDRASKIRANNPLPEPPEWNFKRKVEQRTTESNVNYRGVGLGFAVLYALIGPLMLGFGIGWLIDRRTPGSSAGTVWGTLIGAICGLIGAVVTMVRGTPADQGK